MVDRSLTLLLTDFLRFFFCEKICPKEWRKSVWIEIHLVFEQAVTVVVPVALPVVLPVAQSCCEEQRPLLIFKPESF